MHFYKGVFDIRKIFGMLIVVVSEMLSRNYMMSDIPTFYVQLQRLTCTLCDPFDSTILKLDTIFAN